MRLIPRDDHRARSARIEEPAARSWMGCGAGQPAELRLWVVDREDGMWVGMPRAKAVEHSLDGARLEVLRAGETRCVVPVPHEDRPTVRTLHALKVEKYAVARASAAIGLYPREASEASVSLRLDPRPGG